jgi:hypothetical protein
MGLKTTDSSQNPQVDSIVVDHEGGGTQNELTFGTYSEGTGSNRAIKFRTSYQNEGFYIGTDGNIGIGTTTPDSLFTINSPNSTSNLFQVSSSTNQNIFLIDNDGNVGIGTSSPSQVLSVSGNALADAWLTYSPMYSGTALDSILSIDCIPNTEDGDWCDIEHSSLPNGVNIDNKYMSIDRLAVFNTKAIQEIASVIDLTNAPTTTPSITIDLIGNIGIGTTTPTAKLSIQTDSISSTTPAMSIYNASSTPLMFLMNNGNFGIATDTPTNILTIGQGMGNAIADGWEVYSSREYKTDIIYLEEKDYKDILDEIEEIDVATYKWKADIEEDLIGPIVVENTSTSTNLGIIAEEAPERVLAKDGKAVSLYDYATFAIAGVKALKTEVDELRATLEENGYLSDSDIQVQDDTGIIVINTDGEEVELRVDTDGALVADRIKAKYIETENLKIRAENATASGITIYDSKTGEPYCLYTEYGVPMTRSGECDEVLGGNEPQPVIIEEVIEGNSTTIEEIIEEEVEETSTSTEPIIEEPVIEEPIIEPEPDPEPEPVVEEPIIEPEPAIEEELLSVIEEEPTTE